MRSNLEKLVIVILSVFITSCTSLNKNENDLYKNNKNSNHLEKIDLKSNNKLEKYKSTFEEKTTYSIEYNKDYRTNDIGSSLAKDMSSHYRSDLKH